MKVAGPSDGKLKVGVLGGLLSAEPIGRELTVRLARHLVRGFETSPPHIVHLLNTTIFHIYPQVNRRFKTLVHQVSHIDNSYLKNMYSN